MITIEVIQSEDLRLILIHCIFGRSEILIECSVVQLIVVRAFSGRFEFCGIEPYIFLQEMRKELEEWLVKR